MVCGFKWDYCVDSAGFHALDPEERSLPEEVCGYELRELMV